MRRQRPWLCAALLGAATLAIASTHAVAEPIEYQHGYAFLSAPRQDSGFERFDYVNPDALKGGRMRLPRMGSWDNFNPVVDRGQLGSGLGFWSADENLLWDSLMVPALDEPATQYGLLAEGIAVAEDRAWVAFKLRRDAYWHDGKPITVDDVVYTFEVMKSEASPTIQASFRDFTLEVVGAQEFRFHVPPHLRSDPGVPLRLGTMLIFPKHYFERQDPAKTTVQPPLGSGPYRITAHAVGRWLEFERVPDYWAADLNVNRGRYNFDTIKFDYFRDEQVMTEALKGHIVDLRSETVPRTWYSGYETPALDAGVLTKLELELSRPAGLWWPIFWNMSQPRFQDLRVRRALWLLNDMDWFNERSYGFWGQATSFFHGSELAATGLPGPRELKLLEPLRDLVPETVFTEPYEPQPNAGGGWSRDNIVEAAALLKEAGWVVRDNRLVHGKTGEPFHIRLVAVSPALGGSFVPLTRLMRRLGITSSIKSPEISNWLNRMRSGDFDGGANNFIPNFTPTLHIRNTFAGSEADKPYGSNWSNLKDPAIDALIDAIGIAETWEDYVAAIRAFDRVMLHNYYWLPMMSKTKQALVYWDQYAMPETGRLRRATHMDTWWWDEQKAARVARFSTRQE